MSAWRFFAGRLPAILIWAAVLGVLAQLAIAGWGHGERWLLERQSAVSWMAYESVEFAGVDGDGSLRMRSVSAYGRRLDRVVWVDVLHCNRPGQPPALFSSQEVSAAQFGPKQLEPSEWNYTAPWPPDTICQTRSTVTASYGGVVKTTKVESDLFRTPSKES